MGNKPSKKNRPVLGGVTMGDDGYYHPNSEAQIVSLVKAVAANKLANKQPAAIRVRGSLHSFPHAITGIPMNSHIGTDKKDEKDKPTDHGTVAAICLDDFIGVTIVPPSDNKDPAADGKSHWAVCQAGINLVHDPQNKKSTVKNGLGYQISQQNFALPDLGGIATQTVSGFLSTGSSGGSLANSLFDNVMALRIVDGLGNVHSLSRPEDGKESKDGDLFWAAGVSMGLFGIITQVSFKLVPYFDVIGEEYTTLMDKCPYQTPWNTDETKGGDSEKPTLVEYFRQNEFCRIEWFPQPGVNRMITWAANKMTTADYEKVHQSGPPLQPDHRQPYIEIGNEDSWKVTQVLLQRAAGWLLGEQTGIDDSKCGIGNFAKRAEQWGYAELINAAFVNVKKDGQAIKRFHDYWWSCVPMDQQINWEIMPVVFTELWVPIQYAEQMMTVFANHFKQHGWTASGAFAFEIYTAKRSSFWLSMSCDWPEEWRDSKANPKQEVIRMDVYWPANAPHTFKTQPNRWYSQFWNLLEDSKIPYRAHWGKFRPETPEAIASCLKLYPKMDAWKKFREQMDPNNIFLAPYWKTNLGI